MKTKDYVAMLKRSYKDDEVLAIPFVWCKEDVEHLFEIEISDEDWVALEETYSQDEALCDTSFNTMSELVYLRFKAGR